MPWIQREFDFGEPPEERKAEKPKPALPHFDAPKNDNERLLNWQFAYRTEGDADALAKMYALGKRIALKYINAKARGNRRVAEMGADEKEEKAHNAVTYIVARYLTVGDFWIRDSFTSYLYLRRRCSGCRKRTLGGRNERVLCELLSHSED